MKHLDDWHDVLCKEMDMLYDKGQFDNGGEMTEQHLDTVDKLIHALKSLATYEAMVDSEYAENYSGYARKNSGNNRHGGNRRSRDTGSYRDYGGRDDDGEYEMFRRWMMERGR